MSSQERDPSSALHGFRRLLAWRKQWPLLIEGEIEFLAATESVLAFRRYDDRDTAGVLAAFNLSGQPASLTLPGVTMGSAITGHGLPEGRFANGVLDLPGHGVAFCELSAR